MLSQHLKIRTLFFAALLSFVIDTRPAFAHLSFPVVTCEQAWEGKDSKDYLFQFSTDSELTSRGNEGYRNYTHRMETLGLTPRKECYKNWTVLIYMSATKDLVPYSYADLLEMESGDSYDGTAIESSISKRGSSLFSDVIVEFNAESERQISRLHMFQTEENHFTHLKLEDLPDLARHHIQSPTISRIDKSLIQTEQKRFEDFLKWALQEYPSEHYLVVIWGHGQGWTSVQSTVQSAIRGAPQTQMMQAQVAPMPMVQERQMFQPRYSGRFGGLGVGSSTGYLDIPGLQKVLQEVKEWSGGMMIDIVAPDSCLFQEITDVTQIADCTHYVCGSSGIESYAGFPYGSLLCHLNSRKFDGASDTLKRNEGEANYVAWMIPQLYKEAFNHEKGSQKDLDPDAYRYLTGSSVSTKHLKRSLLPALDHLGRILLAFMEEERPRWMDIKDAIQAGPFLQGGTQDLGLFLRRLEILAEKDIETHSNLATPAARAFRLQLIRTRLALNDSIVNSVLGEEYTPSPDPMKYAGPKGFSIWLPERDDDYHTRIGDYSKSLFFLREGWKLFMQKMYPVSVRGGGHLM